MRSYGDVIEARRGRWISAGVVRLSSDWTVGVWRLDRTVD